MASYPELKVRLSLLSLLYFSYQCNVLTLLLSFHPSPSPSSSPLKGVRRSSLPSRRSEEAVGFQDEQAYRDGFGADRGMFPSLLYLWEELEEGSRISFPVPSLPAPLPSSSSSLHSFADLSMRLFYLPPFPPSLFLLRHLSSERHLPRHLPLPTSPKPLSFLTSKDLLPLLLRLHRSGLSLQSQEGDRSQDREEGDVCWVPAADGGHLGWPRGGSGGDQGGRLAGGKGEFSFLSSRSELELELEVVVKMAVEFEAWGRS